MKRNNWEIVKLKEIAEIIMGQSPKSEFYNTNREGLPFFQGCSEFGELYPVPKKWCTKPLKIAYVDDILMSVRAPVGDLNIADRKCIIGRGLCAIRTKLNSGRFLYHWLKGNIMELILLGSGSVYDAINKSSIENLEIKIPPLEIQRKIAAILSAYDDLIENNTRRIQILEAMAQTIYKEWFVKFRFPGHEKVKMVDSELGKIPEGWAVKRLEDVCSIVMGQSPSSKFYNTNGEGLPFHQGVKDFGARFPTHTAYCTVDKRLAEKGDVLVSVRAPVGRINISNTKIIVGRGLAALRHEELLQSFLFYQLKNIFAEEDSMGSGSIFNAITKEDISNIKFLVPNKGLDSKFNGLGDSMDRQTEILYSQVENLKNTRDLLLPKLILGEVDVNKQDIETGV